MMNSNDKEPHPKRTQVLILITLGFLIIGIGCIFYWWKWGRFDEYTDDAYVSGNLVYVTPQVSGIVTHIYADDTWYVTEGQVLVELDPTDYVLSLEKSKAALGQSIRKVGKLFADANEKKAKIRIAKAQFIRQAQDFERRAILVDSGSVSKEDFSHSIAALTGSYFSLISAEQSYFSLLAQVENTTIPTHPLVEKAIQDLKESWIQLGRCKIKAPTSGLIGQRKAQVGERVNPAEPLLAVIPLENLWIEANFKEDQLGKMQPGQAAKIRTDIYGRDVVFDGRVIGIGGGTGSVFSLLPPQNATGNWIKIVQRVPVRISLQKEQVIEHPLRLGLSTEVNVDLHPIQAAPVCKVSSSIPIYTTRVFDQEEEGSEAIIDAIFQENLPTFPLELSTEEIP